MYVFYDVPSSSNVAYQMELFQYNFYKLLLTFTLVLIVNFQNSYFSSTSFVVVRH